MDPNQNQQSQPQQAEGAQVLPPLPQQPLQQAQTQQNAQPVNQTEPKKGSRKKILFVFIFIIIILGLLVAVYLYLNSNSKKDLTNNNGNVIVTTKKENNSQPVASEGADTVGVGLPVQLPGPSPTIAPISIGLKNKTNNQADQKVLQVVDSIRLALAKFYVINNTFPLALSDLYPSYSEVDSNGNQTLVEPNNPITNKPFTYSYATDTQNFTLTAVLSGGSSVAFDKNGDIKP